MLYTIAIKNEDSGEKLTDGEKLSVIYHDLFDFPLSFSEMIKWVSKDNPNSEKSADIVSKNGYFFVTGKEAIVYKRTLRKRISAKKMTIAKRASRLISHVPTVKMVAVTGSLAMENSTDESDIDLMIITKKGTLWLTRLICLICLVGQIRRAGDKNQKDKLCLNMWLDESDLVWKKSDRNIYTAHEIAQVKPLVNKDKTYEKFLSANKWILKFWPNAVKMNTRYLILDTRAKTGLKYQVSNTQYLISSVFEKIAYQLQYQHMKSKITRETISKTRALFHPQDWGKVVLNRLNG